MPRADYYKEKRQLLVLQADYSDYSAQSRTMLGPIIMLLATPAEALGIPAASPRPSLLSRARAPTPPRLPRHHKPPIRRRRRASLAMTSPGAELWAAYEALADSNSLLTDIVTNGAIHVASDSAAQQCERSGLVATRSGAADGGGTVDIARTARFGTFGSVDGAVSHLWFVVLDAVVGEDGTLDQTLLKVAADAAIYTPLFCVWFLGAFVVLEGRDWRSIPRVVQTEWLELFRGNLGFFLPITGLIYGTHWGDFDARETRDAAAATAAALGHQHVGRGAFLTAPDATHRATAH